MSRRPGPARTSLNPEQLAAVRRTDGPVLVLAGAGSGKTGVITRKIAHLVDGGLAPEQVAAVTFTNKAAREMRGRAAALLGREAAAEVRISTFHRLGLSIVRAATEQLGLRDGFTILDQDDALTLLREQLCPPCPGGRGAAARVRMAHLRLEGRLRDAGAGGG